MRVLILAPFAGESIDRLASNGVEVIHESWLESGELQDPEALGIRLESEGFQAVVVEADFLFDETFAAASSLKLAGICRSATNQIDVDAATDRGIGHQRHWTQHTRRADHGYGRGRHARNPRVARTR